ncbi:MAG: LytTR family DNA-binding domain-containing protein [Gemmatimonadaceae bacterium]
MTGNQNTLKALIVDDERPARQKLRRMLSGDPDIAAIYEAADGAAAIEIIRAEAPDIVFLDVQMPGVDGFGVLEALEPDALPHVIFVTAFDSYATKAFDVHAVDYVLKPFDAQRFAVAFARAKHSIATGRVREERDSLRRMLDAADAARPRRPERILVESDERVLVIAVAKIERITSSRNYVRLKVGNDVHRVRATLAQMEHRLDPSQFVRISRSEIVNLALIAELRPWSHGDYVVVMSDGSQTRLSRRYRAELDRFRSV